MQRKFKLIKDYPENFLKVGDIVTQDTLGQYVSENIMIFDCKVVEDYPEFWEEIIQKEEEAHRFYIDEPVKIWTRTWYDVKGTYEEALTYMKKELENPQLEDDVFDEFEYLYDTVENGYADEKELFNEQGEQL